jgi:TonB family protein
MMMTTMTLALGAWFSGQAPAQLDARRPLEGLAAAWNARDPDALRTVDAQEAHELGEALLQERGAAGWEMELDPGPPQLRSSGPGVMTARLPFRRRSSLAGPSGEEAGELEAALVLERGEWRLLNWRPLAGPWAHVRRVDGRRVRPPRQVKHVRPEYPDLAKQARVQGVVFLECGITAEGKVAHVRVLRPIPLLDDAARDAVRQWEYAPALEDGVAVPVMMTVTVNFKLS